MRRALLFLLVTSCSSTQFDIGAGDSATTVESGGDTSEGPDTAIDSTVVPDVIPDDTSVEPDSGAPDTRLDTAKPDSTPPIDSAMPDTSVKDAPADSAEDTAPVDTCVANACKGCTVLEHEPLTPCGICGGKWSCATTDKVTCSEPGEETTDALYTAISDPAWTIDAGGSAGIRFKTRRAGAIRELTLGIRRVVVDTGAAVGTLRVRLIRNGPNVAPAASDILAVANVPGDSFTTGTGTTNVTFPLSPSVGFDEAVFIELTDNSPRSNFVMLGGPGTAPADVTIYYLSGAAGFVAHTANDSYLVVKTKYCL